MIEFKEFKPIPRMFRKCTVTEKIDGSNSAIIIKEGVIAAQSRERIITPDDDNYGFAQWAQDNAQELLKLGNGHHFGEWYGYKINREYGMSERRFALFNTKRWSDPQKRPSCCDCVPVLFEGDVMDLLYKNHGAWNITEMLKVEGSQLVKGFMKPEGIIIYHHDADQYMKYTLDGDGHKKKGRAW